MVTTDLTLGLNKILSFKVHGGDLRRQKTWDHAGLKFTGKKLKLAVAETFGSFDKCKRKKTFAKCFVYQRVCLL